MAWHCLTHKISETPPLHLGFTIYTFSDFLTFNLLVALEFALVSSADHDQLAHLCSLISYSVRLPLGMIHVTGTVQIEI